MGIWRKKTQLFPGCLHLVPNLGFLWMCFFGIQSFLKDIKCFYVLQNLFGDNECYFASCDLIVSEVCCFVCIHRLFFVHRMSQDFAGLNVASLNLLVPYISSSTDGGKCVLSTHRRPPGRSCICWRTELKSRPGSPSEWLRCRNLQTPCSSEEPANNPKDMQQWDPAALAIKMVYCDL